MAASSKFDSSSGSPDRQLYASGQHGSYTSASLDRPGGFRENMENPILSALPSMSRSRSTVTQTDVISFMQCLRFDPKALAVDHKLNRQGDFKRLASVALGAPDDSPSGSSKGKLSSSSPEELKRMRVCLRESASKARDRVKIFSESLSVINKCFPSIPSRKRSRSDVISGDPSNPLFCDRSVLGGSAGKIGGQSHSMASGFDFEQQKIEERAKTAIPNKRTRTSMMDQRVDGRPNTPARSSGIVDREKEMSRLPNSNAVQSEDRALPIAVDGWEKAKMKKKRSGIKADVTPSPSPSPSPVTTKTNEGYREPKQGMQPRHLSDARSRSNEYGFRQGAVNGGVGVGVGKTDGTSQQTAFGMRSSIPRLEQYNGSLPHDRRERSSGSEKERTNLRAVNKVNAQEELSSSSPTSSGKLHTAARAPRSGSGVVPKLSPVIQRATAANDWELSPCTSKNPVNVGSTNRRSKPPNRSSSPPVTQWADRRPQKMPRTARRTNLVPIVSSIDETPTSDTTSDVGGSENGSSFTRRMPGSSPQHVKLKGDHLPSATLSESEDCGAADIKSRDKGKKTDEVEEKIGLNIQKVSALVLPPRKNKLVNGEGLVDGIRRQGRTGRGFASSRSSPMTVEKLGNVGTAKQLRSAKLGFEKNESKSGRPPTRKLSDRKAYTRQKHTTINPAADFLDDGHEELLAAANAVINPSRALSSSFWRKMEPFFGFLSDLDIAFLKKQGSVRPAVTQNSVALDVDWSDAVPNEIGLIKFGRNATGARGVEFNPEQSALVTSSVEIPLCQRLLAALISEEGNEEPSCSGNHDHNFNDYGSRFDLGTDVESGYFSHQALQNFDISGEAAFDSYGITSTGRSCNELEQSLPDNIIMSMTDTGLTSSCDHSQNGLLLDRAMLPGITCSEYQYSSMSINEKLLLEIQSIGLYPEPVPDLAQTGEDDIDGDICRQEDNYHEQVSRKKSLLDRLLKSACEAREIQEKEFEHHSLDKLIGMAYQKYMSCWGPNASGGKSASGKMVKQAALAFVKRTLDRCQEYEVTGKSCFTAPLFREMFLSGSSHQNDAQPGDAITNGDSGRLYGVSAEVRVSGSQLSPSLNNYDMYSSDALLSANHSSERIISKEDTWSNRVKKRELLFDDVVGSATMSSGAPSGIAPTLLSNAKGKRSDREREGKGNSREALSRNGTTKIGRPASANVKGERKTKTKPKQKTTHLSVSVNGLLGKMSEQPKTTVSSVAKSGEMRTNSSAKEKDDYCLDILENSEAVDFSNLQLPEMDALGVGDDLDEQEDLSSWLNIEDDGLHDDDFMGLEIPMDDLSDLNMMV